MPIKESLILLLKELGLPVCTIHADRHYWFIRTQAGSYFEEFFLDDFVGIGHEDVPCVAEADRTEELVKLVRVNHAQATRVLNQVYKFCTEIKKGDIVVIPSAASAKFAFGYIMDDAVYIEKVSSEDIDDGKCPFTRRRRVAWITGISKNMVDSKLYTFFRNQQTLSQVDEYGDYIERAIHAFYIRDNIAHFTLSVETKDSPNAFDIPILMCGIYKKLEEISHDVNEPIPYKELKARTNVQSPGLIEIFGDPVAVAMSAIVVIGIFGGSIKTPCFSIKTNGISGLLELIFKHMDNTDELKSKIEAPEIKNPTTPIRAIGFNVKDLIDNQSSSCQQPKCNNSTDNPSSTNHV